MKIPSNIWWLTGAATLIRILLAGAIELGNDEVYYITYAQKLQWNYFDHPPLVGILIWLTTLDLSFTHEIFVRLGPVLLAACNTILVFLIAQKINGEKSGYLAALFYTASPYSSIIAGLFIMPDAPMLFFWLISVLLLVQIFDEHTSHSVKNKLWLLVGITIGLAIMGKVHAVFLWFGAGLYILIFDRNSLRNIYLYLSVMLTACIISPILFWNIHNDFITYKFQGARVVAKNGLNPDSFFTELAGGIFYNNPINYFLIIIACYGLLRNKVKLPHNKKSLLFCISLPLIFTLLFIATFRSTLPHWNGPAYTTLAILAGAYLSDRNFMSYKKILTGSNIFILAVGIAAASFINFYPGTIGSTKESEFGDDDLTLELYGWKKFNQDFEKIIKNDVSTGVMPEKSFIVCNKWFPAGHLNFYVALPNNLNLTGIGDLNDIHHFFWLNQKRPALKSGDDAYIIAPSNLSYALNVRVFYEKYFEIIDNPVIVPQLRNGKKVRNFEVYRAHKYKAGSAEGI